VLLKKKTVVHLSVYRYGRPDRVWVRWRHFAIFSLAGWTKITRVRNFNIGFTYLHCAREPLDIESSGEHIHVGTNQEQTRELRRCRRGPSRPCAACLPTGEQTISLHPLLNLVFHPLHFWNRSAEVIGGDELHCGPSSFSWCRVFSTERLSCPASPPATLDKTREVHRWSNDGRGRNGDGTPRFRAGLYG
jgi:hypothetical protein